MSTFTTEDRHNAELEALQKISNAHYHEMVNVFTRKPLSNEQIDVIGINLNIPHSIQEIARAIERAHGIVQCKDSTHKETTNHGN
jgi:hypothetical protein